MTNQLFIDFYWFYIDYNVQKLYIVGVIKRDITMFRNAENRLFDRLSVRAAKFNSNKWNFKRSVFMKNTIKLLGIIALVTMIGFVMAACSDGGGGGGSLGDTLKLSGQVWTSPEQTEEEWEAAYEEYLAAVNAENWSKVVSLNNQKVNLLKYTGNRTFDLPTGDLLTITNGVFNLEIGSIDDSFLNSISSLVPTTYYESVDIDGEEGVKFIEIEYFSDDDFYLSQQDWSYRASLSGSNATITNTNSSVSYIYVTDTVKIIAVGKETGTDHKTITKDFTITLKKGWNAITNTSVYVETGTAAAVFADEGTTTSTDTITVKSGSSGRWFLSY